MIKWDEDSKVFVANIDVWTQGETPREAFDCLWDAIKGYMEVYEESILPSVTKDNNVMR